MWKMQFSMLSNKYLLSETDISVLQLNLNNPSFKILRTDLISTFLVIFHLSKHGLDCDR